jgi:putative ABC transport system permease protein
MKSILTLAWRNIGRNRRRTILTTVAIAFAVMFVLFVQGYMKGILDNFVQNLIQNDTGHVKVAAKEFLRLERILPKEHLIFDSASIEEKIAQMPEIQSTTKRIKFHLVLSHQDKNEPCLGIGIIPSGEKDFLDLEEHIIEGNYLQDSSSEMIIGYSLADKLGVSPGDELLAVTTDINYSTYALTFKVAGLFRTGLATLDKHFFYIPLQKAQILLDCEGAVHEILLFLKDPDEAPTVASNIQEILKKEYRDMTIAAVPWQQHFMIRSYMPYANSFIFVFMLIILFISALVILNTMLMAVLERTHEIGIIKSLGMRDRTINMMIFMESFFIGLIGSAIGGILGTALTLYTQKVGLDFSKFMDKFDTPIPIISSMIHPQFSVRIVVVSVIFALAIALLSALYPSIKASRMTPVEALRSSLK